MWPIKCPISFPHSARPPSMTDDESLTLTTWAITHGCTFHSLEVSPHPLYGGHGLFNSTSTTATKDENERTALFIPNSLIISMDLISESGGRVRRISGRSQCVATSFQPRTDNHCIPPV